MSEVPGVGLSNSIPEVLRHYQSETLATLGRIGITGSVLDDAPSIEGMSGARSRLKSLIRSLTWPKKAGRQGNNPIIQMWPTFGIFEVLLWHRSIDFVVYHDPIPLRRQIGFDSVSRFMARHPVGPRPVVLSHSMDATLELRKIFPRHEIVNVLHPILNTTPSRTTRNRQVVVVGQFKFARDVELLERLGPALSAAGFEPKVFGRGWPQVSGWQVTSAFLSEDDLDQVLATALVVVLPYRKYFQSGVAIRALEMGTPIVSPRTSFIADLLGGESHAIVANPSEVDEWVSAIEQAADQELSPTERTRSRYVQNVDESWSRVFARSSR